MLAEFARIVVFVLGLLANLLAFGLRTSCRLEKPLVVRRLKFGSRGRIRTYDPAAAGLTAERVGNPVI